MSRENICINTSKNSILEDVLVKLKKDKNETFQIKALCTNFICLPINNQQVCDIQNKFDHLRGLKLVDSGRGGDIGILIGSDCYWGLVTGKVKVGFIGEPVVVEIQFRWVLNSPVACSNGESYRVHFASCISAHTMLKTDYSNRDTEDKFWNLETIGVKENKLSNYEKYKNLTTINSEGCYETKQPFKENLELLNDNYEFCKKRLLNLHKKLKQDSELMKKYDSVFKEQKDLGIIEEVSEPSALGETHYIPHHQVIRNDHSTTKLRIVSDASSKTAGPSLNDCLYKGPQMTPLIYDTLLRFRPFVYALTADIEKPFCK